MTLGEKLKMYRVNKGLSQEKIAEMIDVSRQAVTKWEADQTTPSADNLIALAKLYDAVKFTPDKGEISLIVKENPSIADNHVSYTFIVKDNGIGMESLKIC